MSHYFLHTFVLVRESYELFFYQVINSKFFDKKKTVNSELQPHTDTYFLEERNYVKRQLSTKGEKKGTSHS